ncbi:MAG: Hsp20/alpha crystallin family protein [Cyclobacteriaceae bacterium]|nr:Hsp20/alpha crystallin family protein [Cyclobacteriaceae bacterium SS2]
MKVERNLVRNLARTADILNTINGGMSQTTIKIHSLENEWLIKVKTPGVELENLRLEVLDSHLYIHQMMEIDQNSPEKAPYVIAMIPLIKQINVEEISATFEDGWTLIRLPFDEMVNGLDRQIKIVRR